MEEILYGPTVAGSQLTELGGGGGGRGGVAGKGSEMVGEEEGGQRERELELENFILSGL